MLEYSLEIFLIILFIIIIVLFIIYLPAWCVSIKNTNVDLKLLEKDNDFDINIPDKINIDNQNSLDKNISIEEYNNFMDSLSDIGISLRPSGTSDNISPSSSNTSGNAPPLSDNVPLSGNILPSSGNIPPSGTLRNVTTPSGTLSNFPPSSGNVTTTSGTLSNVPPSSGNILPSPPSSGNILPSPSTSGNILPSSTSGNILSSPSTSGNILPNYPLQSEIYNSFQNNKIIQDLLFQNLQISEELHITKKNLYEVEN